MIYIVIPVHNRVNSTVRCLDSIFKQGTLNISVVVVDDGSNDATKDILSLSYSEITVLEGDGSLFWTGAVKLGIDYVLSLNPSNDDDIVLMNNDVVLSENSLNAIFTEYKKYSRNVLFSPITLSLYDKDTIVTTGTVVKSWFLNSTKHMFSGESYRHLPKVNTEVDFLTARFLIHPVNVFNKVGLYDSDNFPHYAGDDEFTYRAKTNGYSLIMSSVVSIMLDTKEGHCKNKSSFIGCFRFCFFDKRSSIGIKDKYNFSMVVVPHYARVSYFIVAFLKTVYVALFRCIALSKD